MRNPRLGRNPRSLSPMLQWGIRSSPPARNFIHTFVLLGLFNNQEARFRKSHSKVQMWFFMAEAFVNSSQNSRPPQPSGMMLLSRGMEVPTCADSDLHCKQNSKYIADSKILLKMFPTCILQHLKWVYLLTFFIEEKRGYTNKFKTFWF